MSSTAKQIQEFIQSEVNSNQVVIFSKTYCPYCRQTKQLFSNLGVQAQIHELDVDQNGALIQRTLLQMTGQRTVPNVFINGKHVGGNDAVQAMNRNGSLVKALKEQQPQQPETSLRSAIQDEIASHDVVVFSKSYCPYCRASKDLLKQLSSASSSTSLDIVVHELDELELGDAMQQELLAMTGQRTVPSIFIHGQHIGGNSDLQEAHRNKSLQARLFDKTATTKKQSSSAKSHSIFRNQEAPADRLL